MQVKALANSRSVVLAEDDPRLQRLYTTALKHTGLNVLAADASCRDLLARIDGKTGPAEAI